MVDPRIYRAALVPALLALIIAAFSLQNAPRTLSSALPPDTFSGATAFRTLKQLERDFPRRRAGSTGDDALGRRVRDAFRSSGFRTTVDTFEGRTDEGDVDLQNVIALRAGPSSERIVVMAHRDSVSSPATAELSGTAALLELSNVFEGRRLRRTLEFVSTSGGSAGSAGASHFARNTGGPVAAVIVLGDLGGTELRKPFVVPWSNGPNIAPLQLSGTVEQAVRQETGRQPGRARSIARFARLAFPLTIGEQGELNAAGIPAVEVQASGERGPGGARAVSDERLQDFGRAVARSITALDAAPRAVGPPEALVNVQRKTVPPWAIRLLVGALILPVLLAAIDAAARANRRGHDIVTWFGWAASGAIPFLAALLFVSGMGWLGLLVPAPDAPAPPGAVPLDGAGIAAMVGVVLVMVLGWVALRPLALRLMRVKGEPDSPGAAAAVALILCTVTVGVWVSNPFAAALVVPALHAWLLVLVPEIRLRRALALGIVLLPLLPSVLIAAYYVSQLGLPAQEVPWTILLLVAGGHLGALGMLAWCALLGCLASVVAIVVARPPAPGPDTPVTVRGPLSYAGPGSLGGTESALRP